MKALRIIAVAVLTLSFSGCDDKKDSLKLEVEQLSKVPVQVAVVISLRTPLTILSVGIVLIGLACLQDSKKNY